MLHQHHMQQFVMAFWCYMETKNEKLWNNVELCSSESYRSHVTVRGSGSRFGIMQGGGLVPSVVIQD